MQVAVILFVVATQVACTVWGQKPVKAWSQATGGEHLERLFWRDMKAQDWNELERHMAPEFTLLTPRGPLDRTATIEYLKQMSIQDYALSEFSVRPIGDGMIVTYTAMVHGTNGTEPISSAPIRMMTVWHRTKSGWGATAHADVAAK
jgi:hypothetical protein